VRRQLGGGRHERLAGVVEIVELCVVEGDLGHPGPAGFLGVVHPVVVGVEADGGRLDP